MEALVLKAIRMLTGRALPHASCSLPSLFTIEDGSKSSLRNIMQHGVSSQNTATFIDEVTRASDTTKGT
jgi:hypothetical protein